MEAAALCVVPAIGMCFSGRVEYQVGRPASEMLPPECLRTKPLQHKVEKGILMCVGGDIHIFGIGRLRQKETRWLAFFERLAIKRPRRKSRIHGNNPKLAIRNVFLYP